MTKANWDSTRYEAFVQNLQAMYRHRQQKPTVRSDELYYRMLWEYFSEPLRAKEEGKPVVLHSVGVPVEILHAMDLCTLGSESFAMIAHTVLGDQREVLARASVLGLGPSVCTVMRTEVVGFVNKWVPADIVIGRRHGCDYTVQIDSVIRDSYQVPTLSLDPAFRTSNRTVEYYASELREMIEFLEGVTGKKLDWDRLKEIMEVSRRTIQLHKETYDLRKASPSPSRNHFGYQAYHPIASMLGTSGAFEFFQAGRDEVKERVDKGEGAVHGERFRIAVLSPPPTHLWKTLGWLERDYKAAVVADGYVSRWGEFNWDLSHPLETLARMTMEQPLLRQLHPPYSDGYLPDLLADLKERQIDGAIFWTFPTCVSAMLLTRMTRDIIREETGIPTLLLNADQNDPTFISDDEVRNRLDGFFETLEDAR